MFETPGLPLFRGWQVVIAALDIFRDPFHGWHVPACPVMPPQPRNDPRRFGLAVGSEGLSNGVLVVYGCADPFDAFRSIPVGLCDRRGHG